MVTENKSRSPTRRKNTRRKNTRKKNIRRKNTRRKNIRGKNTRRKNTRRKNTRRRNTPRRNTRRRNTRRKNTRRRNINLNENEQVQEGGAFSTINTANIGDIIVTDDSHKVLDDWKQSYNPLFLKVAVRSPELQRQSPPPTEEEGGHLSRFINTKFLFIPTQKLYSINRTQMELLLQRNFIQFIDSLGEGVSLIDAHLQEIISYLIYASYEQISGRINDRDINIHMIFDIINEKCFEGRGAEVARQDSAEVAGGAVPTKMLPPALSVLMLSRIKDLELAQKNKPDHFDILIEMIIHIFLEEYYLQQDVNKQINEERPGNAGDPNWQQRQLDISRNMGISIASADRYQNHELIDYKQSIQFPESNLSGSMDINSNLSFLRALTLCHTGLGEDHGGMGGADTVSRARPARGAAAGPRTASGGEELKSIIKLLNNMNTQYGTHMKSSQKHRINISKNKIFIQFNNVDLTYDIDDTNEVTGAIYPDQLYLITAVKHKRSNNKSSHEYHQIILWIQVVFVEDLIKTEDGHGDEDGHEDGHVHEDGHGKWVKISTGIPTSTNYSDVNKYNAFINSITHDDHGHDHTSHLAGHTAHANHNKALVNYFMGKVVGAGGISLIGLAILTLSTPPAFLIGVGGFIGTGIYASFAHWLHDKPMKSIITEPTKIYQLTYFQQEYFKRRLSAIYSKMVLYSNQSTQSNKISEMNEEIQKLKAQLDELSAR